MVGRLPHGQDQPLQQPPYLRTLSGRKSPRLALVADRLLRARGGRRVFLTPSPR